MNSKLNSNTQKMSQENTVVNTLNTEEGNTKPPPKTMRKLCFTINNYTNTEYKDLLSVIDKRFYKAIIGKEVGENGTPHLQGYIEFHSPKTWSTIKKLLPRAHIERAKGTRAQNVAYCSKGGDYVSKFPVPMKDRVLDEYKGIEWKDWQKEIIELYVTEPDKRKIYWITDLVGNSGKSFLTRYLVVKNDVLLANGKMTDVFHQVAKRLENPDEERDFRMVILDIPRHAQDFTNYALLESLKNGLVMSGKYEGGTFAFPVPHVVVMSNAEPDFSKFSMDRWVHIIL